MAQLAVARKGFLEVTYKFCVTCCYEVLLKITCKLTFFFFICTSHKNIVFLQWLWQTAADIADKFHLNRCMCVNI